jgi:fructokinase
MKFKAVCFGEVLWDVFSDKASIGGAPLNVASRLSAIGIETEIISRIGKDQKGKELIDYLSSINVGTKNIEIDTNY